MGIFITFSSIKEPSSKMQISNIEKGDRKRGQATFLEPNKGIPHPVCKRKGNSDSSLFEKSSLSPFFPCFTLCLQVTRFDKNPRMT